LTEDRRTQDVNIEQRHGNLRPPGWRRRRAQCVHARRSPSTRPS
jgi:hypothetical protein